MTEAEALSLLWRIACHNVDLGLPVDNVPPSQLPDLLKVAERERLLGHLGAFAPRAHAEHTACLLLFTRLMGESSRLTNLFAKHGIPIMALKGVHLGLSKSPVVFFRPMGDVDLLVPENKVGQALDLLNADGYVSPAPEFPYRWHRQIIQRANPPSNCPLGRTELNKGNLCVDLHWSPQYILGDQIVGLNLERVWTADRNLAALVHQIVHTDHTGCEGEFQLRHFLDLAVQLETQPVTSSEVMSFLECPGDTSIVAARIEKILATVRALRSGELEPYLELSQTPRPLSTPTFPEPPWKITGADRWLFFLGYLFPARLTSWRDLISHYRRLVARVFPRATR